MVVNEVVSGHSDPEGEVPWAMQVVVRVERGASLSHSAVCEAVASMVVRFLADVRCRGSASPVAATLPGREGAVVSAAPTAGVWAPAVERWLRGRIRKVVRRARGSAWERVQAVDGLTGEVGGVEVRVLVPCPVDQVPRSVSRLQVRGFELTDPLPSGGPVDGPVVVSLSADPVLGTGKAAAAAGHAVQLAASAMPAGLLARWEASGFVVRVECPSLARWEDLVRAAPVVVTDAGFTEVAPGTVTATARWSFPGPAAEQP